MNIYGNVFDALHQNMDLRLQREGLIHANIANAETPGYRPVDLDFQDQLNSLLKTEDQNVSVTSGNHLGAEPSSQPINGEVVEQAGEVSADGNAVDIERQMAELASNSFNYKASARMVTKKLALIKYVINESR